MKDPILNREALPLDDICVCGVKLQPEQIPFGCDVCYAATLQRDAEIASRYPINAEYFYDEVSA